jgi:Rrf2 family protein
MPLFSAKVDYALRAMVDLAQQPQELAVQSREIARRQDIRGPYLDQILAVLKREGIIRSIRGAGGGYALARPPYKVTIGEIVRAVAGEPLLLSPGIEAAQPTDPGDAYTVQQLAIRCEKHLNELLNGMTLQDLAAERRRLAETLSYMAGI